MARSHVRPTSKLLMAIAAVVFLSAPAVRAADWAAFRGTDRNGIAPEGGGAEVPLAWSASNEPGAAQTNVKWKVALPAPGNSSPVVSGGRVFLTCAEDAHGLGRSLYCFDRADGRKLWVKTVAYQKADPTHGRNPYCASTPAADGKRVYVWHGSAGLYCYDYEGNELWSRDLGTFRHIWGYASSPVVYGDSVLLNCGPGERSFVVAVARESGKVLWQTDEPGGAADKSPRTGNWLGSWATPAVAKVAGRNEVLVPMPGRVNAYDPATGKILWTCDGLGDLAYGDVMVGASADGGPAVALAAAGYGGAAIGFRLPADLPAAQGPGAGGPADITATHRLWRVTQHNPQRVGTGVIVGGYAYLANEPGASCVELETGKELWRQPGGQTYWGSIVSAGGRLYLASQQGATVVFAPDAKGFKLLAKNDNGEGSNSTPAVSDGEIFLRTYQHLFCVAAPRGPGQP